MPTATTGTAPDHLDLVLRAWRATEADETVVTAWSLERGRDPRTPNYRRTTATRA
jgi:hypothetical protein